jgi:hypothetical protein
MKAKEEIATNRRDCLYPESPKDCNKRWVSGSESVDGWLTYGALRVERGRLRGAVELEDQ